MQKVTQTSPKRSLTRRLILPITCLALLSGGGYGAYSYYGSEPSELESANENPFAAHSAPSDNEELQLLFSSDEPEQKVAEEEPKPVKLKSMASSSEDRYARSSFDTSSSLVAPPKLPPLVNSSSDDAMSEQGNSGSQSAPASAVGDRYARAMTTLVKPDEPKQEEVEQPEPPAEASNDVARGQEPSASQIRIAPTTSSTPEEEARAAFGDALAQAPESATPTPANPPTNDLNSALQQARPLQPTPPAGLVNSRYQAAPPVESTPPAMPPVQQQRPAPPLDLPVQASPQHQTQQQPAPMTNPFGAPPAGMMASRAPATPPAAMERQLPPPTQTRTPQAPGSQGLALQALASQGLTPTPGISNHPGTGRPGESLLEGAQSPAITIQKLSPEEIQVGKRCTFAIRIQNSGQRTAHNVQIHDEVPLGTELVGTAPRATISGTEVVWDMGTLSPGEERTVEMELMPVEEGELGSVATVSLAAQASAKSRCTRPELALRLTSKPQVHVGDQHIVQIELSNPGSGDATGVMLLESVPAGVSHEAGPALEFEVGTLRAGENRTMELVLTAEQAGQISNVMVARADAGLQEEASCEFEVIAPELELSIEGPQRRFLERPATYKVSIDNPGTASAKDVQLVTHLPKGMQFVSANNMGEYDSSTHSVHWSLAELPANERGTVELKALPIEPGAQTLKVETKARQGLADMTDKQVQVEGLSALMFEVEDVEGLIEIGGETTYEIRVRNQGSKAASNVQVVALMPSGIRPLSGQGETRNAIQGERVVFAPLPQLAPKSETTYRIVAQGVRPGDQRVRVQINADDLQQPITKEVSTKVYADE